MTIVFHEIPEFLKPYLEVPCLLRLKDVGMNCGMNYTSFPLFKNLPFYSRYDHSLRTALAAASFTDDHKVILAALFHDVATPVFAHTIDFLQGDHEKQNATEEGTHEILAHDRKLVSLLALEGLKVTDIDDYHRYPLCDNDTPRLSCDRLEYTIDNAYYYGFATKELLQACFDDLYLGLNEDGIEELSFAHEDLALTFGLLSIKCGLVYCSDEDRYGMETLAMLVKEALLNKVLTRASLYTTETNVINKIKKAYPTQWQAYTSTCALEENPQSGLIVSSKKRYITPLVDGKRLNHPAYKKALDKLLNKRFDRLLAAKK